MIKLKILKSLLIALFFLLKSNYVLSNDEFKIEAEKIQYIDNNKTIIAIGNAIASNQLGYKVSSNKIIYYKDKDLIHTYNNSKYEDGINIITAKSFKYDLKIKSIEAQKNVILIDGEKNKFSFDFFKYFVESKKGYGENGEILFSDGSYLKTKKVNANQKIIELQNANYTTCSELKDNKNNFCPTWSLKSNKIIYDKNKKIITHKNAFLKIKNIPILYTPYVSHPDPSVKRQSGFLPPLIKSISNIGRTTRTPYFWAISDDKDLTITPIYYFNEKDSILTSYRQVFKNSSLNIETAYSGGYKKLNKTGRTKGSRNYLFADYQIKNKENVIFKNNEINFKIQRISQENFTRVNKFNTKLFKEDIRTLENSFKINSFEGQKRLDLKVGIFENLDVSDSSKYTYFFPDGLYAYNYNGLKNFNINYTNYFQGKKFSKYQKQFKIRNLISASSNKYANKNLGIGSQLKINMFNKNIYNDKVTDEKQNTNIDNFITVALDNSLPLIKFDKNLTQTITPKIFFKYTTGSMQDAINNDKILDYSDIYSMNRTNNLDLPEVGLSLGQGIEYSLKKKNEKQKNLYNFSSGIGQVIRTNKLDKMPSKSSLNNSASDFAGFFNFDFFGKDNNQISGDKKNIKFLDFFTKDFINFNYKYNLDNNLKKLNRNNISINSNYNRFNLSLNYDEKNNHIGNDRSTSFNIKTLLDKNYYFKIDAKKNLLTNKSEYLNFSINYENDCILTSLSLAKDFYNDKDIVNSKTLILSIIIKPFSDSFAPDLTNFIE